jgi:hypothetical protein
MLGTGRLPRHFGPPWLWLVAGAVVAAAVFFGLYVWQKAWFARVVWGVHGLRLPALVKGAFFAGAAGLMPPSFHLMAIVVVTINLWMLARAGWDL